ncbi:pentatricopeptide repeat-containing protein At3g63370, chloroplastic [Apium graveolens]|uniref:pentatricopeptide repeat-containing protein At3g63370, chloroplastic n=1 Tax=Apium graveolens TaxID=4045 RepID=UPI003D78CD4D
MSPFISNAIFTETHTNIPHKNLNFSKKIVKTKSLRDNCKQGNLKEAFASLADILADQNASQDCFDEPYSLVLELCASQKALYQGKQIHTHVLKSNNVYDQVFLRTKLVFFYGKCGVLLDARKVFDEMSERSVFTWNAMIGSYVINGEPFEALELHREMWVSGDSPDAWTFTSVLKACGEVMDICNGRQIHGLVIKQGLFTNVFVVNSLMAMYTKCSDQHAAMLLFDRMAETKDVVSWNSIISGFNANKQYMEAVSGFRDMLIAGIPPTTYTFVIALQACEESAFVRSGMQIHATVLKSCHYADIYVANALVVMYSRWGKMAEAARVFYDMEVRDNISWNSMLSGLVQNSLYYESLKIFREMQSACYEPDQCSILSMLATSGRLGNLFAGMELHAYTIKNGIDSDLQVGNTLIDMYAKCCKIDYMNSVFDRLLFKDDISWATILAGYVQNNCYLKAIQIFREALIKRVNVDSMIIGSILQACSGLNCISLVKELHGYTIRRKISDIVLENTFLDLYGGCRYVDYALHCFESMKVKDVVSWTSMISCYIDNQQANEGLSLFISMIAAGIESDSIALVSALSAAADLSALRKGKEIHGFLIRKGFIKEGFVAGSLVDMYACCGAVQSSWKVFSCVDDKDLILWTTMIDAYGMHGYGETAIRVFQMMVDEKIHPDHISFLALLYACSHSALVDEGRRYFKRMICEYKLEPWPEHYVCLVDMLARANQLDEAFQFVEGMEVEPTAAVYCALLNACHIHHNKERSDLAAKKLLELDPWDSGNYVLISNVYASQGRWDNAEEVRAKMKEKGLTKDPACSWIEVGNNVHTFMAGDRSHPESDKIHRKLANITKRLEIEGGYVAQTKFVLHNVDEKEKVKMLHGHSERLAIAYGLLQNSNRTPIRIAKNLRICDDCHTFSKLVSKLYGCEIIARDANRFHHFVNGVCSCGNFW